MNTDNEDEKNEDEEMAPEENESEAPESDEDTETSDDDDGETDEGSDDEDSDDESPDEEDDGELAEEDSSESEGADESETSEEEEYELPLESAVEAILFSARQPMKINQIARAVGKGTRRELVKDAIDALNAYYTEQNRSFEIVEVAERYQFMTRPEYASLVGRMFGKPQSDRKLSGAALDTLSIIAYKQPITRADVETIRGVGCGPILRQLIERGSVRIVGRKEDVIGHPFLYGTTESFLTEFGLSSLDEMPMIHELRSATGSAEPLPSGEEEADSPQTHLHLVDSDEDPEEEEELDDEEFLDDDENVEDDDDEDYDDEDEDDEDYDEDEDED